MGDWKKLATGAILAINALEKIGSRDGSIRKNSESNKPTATVFQEYLLVYSIDEMVEYGISMTFLEIIPLLMKIRRVVAITPQLPEDQVFKTFSGSAMRARHTRDLGEQANFVRFQLLFIILKRPLKIYFNSTLVRFQLELNYLVIAVDKDFNSTLVRFQLELTDCLRFQVDLCLKLIC